MAGTYLSDVVLKNKTDVRGQLQEFARSVGGNTDDMSASNYILCAENEVTVQSIDPLMAVAVVGFVLLFICLLYTSGKQKQYCKGTSRLAGIDFGHLPSGQNTDCKPKNAGCHFVRAKCIAGKTERISFGDGQPVRQAGFSHADVYKRQQNNSQKDANLF